MKHEIKHPDKQVSTGAYSAAIAMDGWLFVSGQGPLDLKTGQVCPGTIAEETRLTMQHIGKILAAAGCTFADVVRCGCHLAVEIDCIARLPRRRKAVRKKRR